MRKCIALGLVVAAATAAAPSAMAQQPAPTPATTPAPAPAPPSTGKEMPAPDKPLIAAADANKAVLAAVAKAAQKSECDGVVRTLQTVLPFATVSVDDRKRALIAMQRCANLSKRWRAVIWSTEALLKIDPTAASPDDEIRALVEMGEIPAAIERGKKLLKLYPKSRNELTAAVTFLYCKQEAYAECVKASQLGMQMLSKAGVAPTAEPYLKNQLLGMGGLIGVGDFKGFEAQFAAATATLKAAGKPVEALQSLRRLADATQQRGMYLRLTPSKEIPLGVYHLMNQPDGEALLAIRLVNHQKTPRTFRVELDVAGVTDTKVATFTAAPGKVVDVKIQPTLKIDFNIDSVRAARPTQVNFKFIETTGGKNVTLFDETPQVDVLPRDYLPLHRLVGADSNKATLQNLGAWVTPNVKPVDEFLAKAKERAPDRTFAGKQRATVPQVAALFDELKARGVSYVMDPDVLSERLKVQRTRLPADVLQSSNAQCLEGTLLFATLMESIGLDPIIVLVPGHAFVGWGTAPKDKLAMPALFVETTMVGNATFEQAVRVATQRVQQEGGLGNFDTGVSKLIPLKALRKAGVTPQPY